MNQLKSIIDIIRVRTSWRNYTSDSISDAQKKIIRNLLNNLHTQTPFSEYAGKCRFEFVKMNYSDPKEKKQLGTYGFIKGARYFIVGIVEKSKSYKYNKENFGYLFESLILSLTKLGYGTCWLGGTFNKKGFYKKIQPAENEKIFAVTPVGNPTKKRRFIENRIRQLIKADKRKPWSQIFFYDNFSESLTKIKAGKFLNILEMVRLAPSAGNKQPWRIIKEKHKNIFHFYRIIGKYSKFSNYNFFHQMDLGIAVCHFDLSATETGMKGNWKFMEGNSPELENGIYCVSWVEDYFLS